MRLAEAAFALPLAFVAAAPATAQTVRFDIPGGRLSVALVRLAEQARITINASDPALARLRSRPLRGTMTARAALDTLLAGSGFTYRFVGERVVRIVPAPAARAAPPPRPPPARPPPAAPQIAPEGPLVLPDIIVTASKLGTALDRFAGTVHLIDLAPEDGARFGARGSEAILNRLPMLASTSLGPGRNKIYIRGIADSSFNGPSQSIVGQYLGDVRLTFNAPDPDLHLHDIRRVELLEGPQGTLYGSGSLGGILRLVPNDPDPAGFAGAGSAGLATTRHGGEGRDAHVMVNLPIARDRLAVRAVGYESVEAGYIDDAGRGLSDVNRTRIRGGRAMLLWDAGDDWQIALGGLAQDIVGRDGQYAMRGLPPLTRRSSLAQPFDNDYRLGQVTIRKRWNGIELVSATGIVDHALANRFDATGLAGTSGPQVYEEEVDITLVSTEARLSQPDARGEGWVIGVSLLHDVNRISRSLGPAAAPTPITGVRNQTREAALFGQYSHRLSGRLVATVGGRLTYSRTAGEPLDAPDDAADDEAAEPRRTHVRASPTAALTWRPANRLLVYARYQQGFRAGGLAVSPTDGAEAPAVQRFDSDRLTSIEAGFRWGRRDRDRLTLHAALSYASWTDVQADLVDPNGLPFTTNLGDGRIYGLEVEASWRIMPSLTLDAAAFLNDSALSSPRPQFAEAEERDLPNIARTGGRAAAHFRTDLAPSLALAVDGAVRYVGESHLGIGAPTEGEQGGYLEAEIGARLEFGRFGLSLDVTNAAEARGNRFSYGNPFSLADGTQITPLRPRTIRLGLDTRF